MAMSEYNRQMHMLDYLHSVYPRVHISLHAGELAPGLVPPEGLRFHIREAVELGHAERIGHGVDVMYESDPRALLREMAEPPCDGGDQPHLERRDPGHRAAAPSAAGVPRGACAGGALDRR